MKLTEGLPTLGGRLSLYEVTEAFYGSQIQLSVEEGTACKCARFSGMQARQGAFQKKKKNPQNKSKVNEKKNPQSYESFRTQEEMEFLQVLFSRWKQNCSASSQFPSNQSEMMLHGNADMMTEESVK